MDQVLNEIPIAIEKLEGLSKNIDDKFGWKEFKFCFKFATSHIVSWSEHWALYNAIIWHFSSSTHLLLRQNGILSKLLEHKATLIYPIMELCQLVNKSAFTNKLVQIGLLDRQVAQNFDASDDSDNVDSEKEKPLNTDYSSYKINLSSGLCESPNAINSNLSKNAVSIWTLENDF